MAEWVDPEKHVFRRHLLLVDYRVLRLPPDGGSRCGCAGADIKGEGRGADIGEQGGRAGNRIEGNIRHVQGAIQMMRVGRIKRCAAGG